jgi:hypothetical protein
MPRRMLRDWTNSEQVDKLTWQAEVLFTRLIMKADDYGRFYADPRLIKASLFPRRLDRVRDADISRWLTECQESGLIAVYEAQSKTYLEIKNFGQKKVHMKADYPPPEIEVEENIEKEIEAEAPKPAQVVFPFLSDLFLKKWNDWREYKKKEFKFKFKSVESENASLEHLKNLSGGVEKTAIAIIDQSLSNTWKGFFELKETKQVNGFGKPADGLTYTPPKVKEPDAPLVTGETVQDAFISMIKYDIEKFTASQEFKPQLSAKKLDWLIIKGRVNLSKEDRESYFQEAQTIFIQQISESRELIPSRALMDYYKANKSFRSEDQEKIKVIAKELAYMVFLKSKIPETVIT